MAQMKPKNTTVFGTRLEKLMKEKGVTHRVLAETLHMSRTATCYYTNGQGEPSIATICALCRYFDVSADWLLGISDFRR